MGSGEKMILNEFNNELLIAESILDTKYSFELAEPNYLKCLEIVEKNPDLQTQFESSLISLFDSKKLSDEPIAYLMFKLRWLGVKHWVEEELKSLPNPMVSGASLSKILEAYEDDWDNKDFYQHL